MPGWRVVVSAINTIVPPRGTFRVTKIDGAYRSMIPATIINNIRFATEMRFGNTPEELERASWITFQRVFDWLLRTGAGEKTVYGEFRDKGGHLLRHAVTVDTGYIVNSFERSQEGWWSYWYDPNTTHNIFYPTTWHPTGGVDNSGYVSTDSSRWAVDTPETPDSILAFITYPSWTASSAVDFRNATVSFSLRENDLDLHGARAYFWVVDNESSMRWHLIDQPLMIGNDSWSESNILKIDASEERWRNTWNARNLDPRGSLDSVLAGVDSYGISFLGFSEGETVSGTLALDEFIIEQPRY